MPKIKILVGCADDNNSYQNGHEYEVSDATAKDLVNAKYAILVDQKSAPKTETAAVKPKEIAKKK